MLTVMRNVLYEGKTKLKMPWLVLKDGIPISDFLTKRAAQGTINSMKCAQKFPWRESEYTINEICDIHFKETKIRLSNQVLRWRMSRSKNDVDKALNYKGKTKLRVAKSKECPDGVSRTDKEIASHLGLSYSGWISLKNRLGFSKAFAAPRRVFKKADVNKKPGIKQKHMCPDGIERTHRQIAKFLGIKLSTWRGRYRKDYTVETAWNYESSINQPINREPVIKTSEEVRQQKALDALPSACTFEEQFW